MSSKSMRIHAIRSVPANLRFQEFFDGWGMVYDNPCHGKPVQLLRVPGLFQDFSP